MADDLASIRTHDRYTLELWLSDGSLPQHRSLVDQGDWRLFRHNDSILVVEYDSKTFANPRITRTEELSEDIYYALLVEYAMQRAADVAERESRRP